jgi:hypothetical protein
LKATTQKALVSPELTTAVAITTESIFKRDKVTS